MINVIKFTDNLDTKKTMIAYLALCSLVVEGSDYSHDQHIPGVAHLNITHLNVETCEPAAMNHEPALMTKTETETGTGTDGALKEKCGGAKPVKQIQNSQIITRRWIRTLSNGTIEDISEAELEAIFPKPDLKLFATNSEKNREVLAYFKKVEEAGYRDKRGIALKEKIERIRKIKEEMQKENEESKDKSLALENAQIGKEIMEEQQEFLRTGQARYERDPVRVITDTKVTRIRNQSPNTSCGGLYTCCLL